MNYHIFSARETIDNGNIGLNAEIQTNRLANEMRENHNKIQQ